MYIRLVVVLTISWLAWHGSCSYAADEFDSTSNNLLLDELTKSCPSNGIPVCGVIDYKQYVIFPNECLLEEVNKNIFLAMTYFKKVPLKQCIYGCQLYCPKEYKPICAKNLRTREKKIYYNLCELTKYACQSNMDFIPLKLHECESRISKSILNHSNKLIAKRSKTLKKRPVPCTNIFKPVCASYLGVKSTFKNECILNAENINFHRDWRIVKMGICAEDYANVQQVKKVPSKPHSIKKRSYAHNNFDDFPNRLKYETNNFVDYKSEADAPPNNGVYVYMPTPFQTQFLDHSYHQPMKVANAYNDILKSIISMPTEEEENMPNRETPSKPMPFINMPNHKNVDYRETPSKPMPFINMPNHKNMAYQATPSKPMPFTANGMNFNYLPNEISRNDHHIPTPQASAVNNFMDPNSNKDYFYTFEKVQHNAEPQNMARPESEQPTFVNNEPTSEQVEQMPFENTETNQETEQFTETTTSFSTTTETTEIPTTTTTEIPTTTTEIPTTTTEIPTTTTELPTTTTTNQEVIKSFKSLKEEKKQECKFGSLPICGVLPDGTVKTFDSVCEMMTTNIYMKYTWTKLHEGECGNCKYNCTRDYQPICVTRNDVNYTMVNDCYFNMGICMDKKSIWKKIANGECERYTRIPDKYENSKPGFPFTSSNFESSNSTTMINTITTTTPIPTTSTTLDTVNTDDSGVGINKPLRMKFRKPNNRKLSSKRVVNRRSSVAKTSSNANEISKKDVTTERPTTRLSLYGPHTNSYIMRLVSERVNRKFPRTT